MRHSAEASDSLCGSALSAVELGSCRFCCGRLRRGRRPPIGRGVRRKGSEANHVSAPVALFDSAALENSRMADMAPFST